MIRMIAVLLLVSGAASAETIFKCVDKNGAVSYQNDLCASHQRLTKAQVYTPEPPLTPEQRRAAEVRAPRARAESAYLSRAAGTDAYSRGRPTGAAIPVQRGGSACEAAKAHRQATLDSVGLRRTYELLQRLDETVREACK